MASVPQIEANRRNARKSTGPRSAAGKMRTSGNSYRHGLSLSINSGATIAKQLDKRAHQIADGDASEIALEHARPAAHAELELARVRKVKIALIERVMALGSVEAPQPFGSGVRYVRLLKSVLDGKARFPDPIDPLADMPPHGPQRLAEAVRRALPELQKLDRYERRASERRDRAIREIYRSRSYIKTQS